MSFFPHYAEMTEDYAPLYEGYNELTIQTGELVQILLEHPNNGWSRCKRLSNGEIGVIPTSYFKYVKLTRDPNNPEKITDVKDHIYEQYYRNYTYHCSKCGISILAPDERVHCLDCGDSDDKFNLCMKCFNGQDLAYWTEDIKRTLPLTLVNDPFFVTTRRHPAELLWLCSGSCVAQSLNNALQCFANRPCLGYRRATGYHEKEKRPIVESKYTWITYKEIHERSLALGTGLQEIVRAINRENGHDENKRGFVGLCSINKIEWFIADFGLMMKGMVPIPLPKSKFDNEDLVDMAHVCNNAEVTVVVCTRQYTAQCLTLASNTHDKDKYCPSLKAIVQMDDLNENNELDITNAVTARNIGIKLFSMSAVEKLGLQCEDYKEVVQDMSEDELVTIVYTSGSTGRSKGAIITNKNFNSQIIKPYYAFHPLVGLSFCPLSHMSDRLNVFHTIVNGGRVGMFSGDMSLIFEDFQSLQPTVLSSTPRLYNSIFAEYQKTKLLMETSGAFVSEDELMKKFSSILGGRMQAMTTGGAATSKEVIEFLRQCFKCKVYNGYASTELGTISWIDINDDSGFAKMYFDGVEVKLIDVPELGYLSTDLPYPRGEICVKSATAIPGYYKDPVKTRELIGDDGFYHTGDIGAMDNNGKLIIIDRLKNIFKLAQGEFVAPEPLEITYLSSKFIDQIFIFGDSMKTFLVAVVVPNIGVVEEFASNSGLEGSLNEWCQRDTLVYNAIMADLVEIGKSAKVASYEIPKGFIFELEKFTVDNGKLTGPQKSCRPYLGKVYKDQLNALYDELETKSNQIDLISSISEALGLEHIGSDTTFAQVGGDSISAARISALLEKQLNIQVSAKQLLQNISITDIAEMIRTGKYKQVEEVIDLEKEVYLDPSIMATQEILNTVKPPEAVEHILLTGASGFLGGALLSELLQQTHVPKCKIHCIVRARDDESAMKRLLTNLQTMKCQLSPEQLSRIVAYSGDLAKPRLGLSEQVWRELGRMIDCVYHNGAHVNFILSYRDLYDTNVQSVIELLKLCVMGDKLKPMHFISSIGVLGHKTHGVRALENDVLDDTTFHQLQGYSQSKFVSEKVLAIARDERKIPVSIFRPELICGDSTTGHSNAAEWISRFICGIIQMGVAPLSDSLVHMVPVDFVAKSVVGLTNQSKEKLGETLIMHKIFHIVNTNPEQAATISVNNMVKYIQSFGYPIKQIEYGEWVQYLQNELRESSEHGSKNPLFPIVSMFSPFGFPDSRSQGIMDTHNLEKGLQGTGIECPSVNSEHLMHLFLQSFIDQSEIPQL